VIEKVRKLFKSPLLSKIMPFGVVLLFALLAGRSLLQPGYFNMHDDLQMMRQLEMEKCFLDLQIPCRWVPDMGYGFGYPLFNYYPPLPYLTGEIFRVVGFAFTDTVKIVFLLSFIVSGIGMYLLAKEFFGKWGGVLSSIFYIWAPYHSVDIYVRGAMNEAWALAWFPFILWCGYKLVINPTSPKASRGKQARWIIALSLSWVGLLLSHNLMVMIFAPVFAGWCLIWLVKTKKFNHWPLTIGHFVLSGLLAAGLSAFFTFPSILEQKYVQVSTLIVGYYEYIAHFADINQLLFSRFWGYGPSVWGTNDGMPFQVGHIHWILSLIIIFVIVIRVIKRIKQRKTINPLLLATSYLLLISWFATFMAHSKSTFIWQMIPLLKFVQFPWRFLALTIVGLSFAAGSIAVFIKNTKLLFWVSGFLIAGILILNWNYFKPEKMGPLTDTEKFSAAAWELQQTAGIYDYLPKTAETAPKEPRKDLAEFVTGRGEVGEAKEGTNHFTFSVKVDSTKASLRINTLMYPAWTIWVNGEEYRTYVDKNEKWGRFYIDLDKGSYEISGKLENTTLRIVSNVISLIAWLGLFGFLIYRNKKNVWKKLKK
jgi:hypothetical protein